MGGEETAPALAALFPDSAIVGERLRATGRTVAVAESCTGGLLGAVLTAVPGSSAYVLGGVIAYSNTVKTQLLGVPAAVLHSHGAVSSETAVAMARGVRERLGSDVGLAITGVAGPGDEHEPAEAGDEAPRGVKPAGLVFVALADASGERVIRRDEDGGRDGNRAAAVRAALRLLLEDRS